MASPYEQPLGGAEPAKPTPNSGGASSGVMPTGVSKTNGNTYTQTSTASAPKGPTTSTAPSTAMPTGPKPPTAPTAPLAASAIPQATGAPTQPTSPATGSPAPSSATITRLDGSVANLSDVMQERRQTQVYGRAPTASDPKITDATMASLPVNNARSDTFSTNTYTPQQVAAMPTQQQGYASPLSPPATPAATPASTFQVNPPTAGAPSRDWVTDATGRSVYKGSGDITAVQPSATPSVSTPASDDQTLATKSYVQNNPEYADDPGMQSRLEAELPEGVVAPSPPQETATVTTNQEPSGAQKAGQFIETAMNVLSLNPYIGGMKAMLYGKEAGAGSYIPNTPVDSNSAAFKQYQQEGDRIRDAYLAQQSFNGVQSTLGPYSNPFAAASPR